MSFKVLLNNLNPCPNYNFYLKGIKLNALSGVIDFNFFSWINIDYIYVWQCSLNAFDYIIKNMKILRSYNSFKKGYKEKDNFLAI